MIEEFNSIYERIVSLITQSDEVVEQSIEGLKQAYNNYIQSAVILSGYLDNEKNIDNKVKINFTLSTLYLKMVCVYTSIKLHDFYNVNRPSTMSIFEIDKKIKTMYRSAERHMNNALALLNQKKENEKNNKKKFFAYYYLGLINLLKASPMYNDSTEDINQCIQLASEYFEKSNEIYKKEYNKDNFFVLLRLNELYSYKYEINKDNESFLMSVKQLENMISVPIEKLNEGEKQARNIAIERLGELYIQKSRLISWLTSMKESDCIEKGLNYLKQSQENLKTIETEQMSFFDKLEISDKIQSLQNKINSCQKQRQQSFDMSKRKVI